MDFRVVLHRGRRTPDPARRGLPEFTSVPLKKRHSWRPRSLEEEDSAEVRQLLSKIKMLAQSGYTIVEVINGNLHSAAVQPLQYRGPPMWHYNGEDDASRCGRKGPDTPAALAKIIGRAVQRGGRGIYSYQAQRWILHVQSS